MDAKTPCISIDVGEYECNLVWRVAHVDRIDGALGTPLCG